LGWMPQALHYPPLQVVVVPTTPTLLRLLQLLATSVTTLDSALCFVVALLLQLLLLLMCIGSLCALANQVSSPIITPSSQEITSTPKPSVSLHNFSTIASS